MGNLQVKDVPEDLHVELRRRAARRDMTIRDYVLELIRRDQATPSLEEWLEDVRSWPPLDGELDAAGLIREVRRDRDRELGISE
jgi:hypothetical protein